MFVPHSLERIFDVENHNDRCVCGASAVVTSGSGYDKGYCHRCSSKRDKFINGIVGDIDMYADKNETELALILEQIRKRTIKERLYYLVDKWFVENNKSLHNHGEPYADEDFFISCMREKNETTNILFHHLLDNNFLPDDEYQSPLLRTSYYNAICNMWHRDHEKICALLSEHYSCNGCISKGTCDMLEITYTNCKTLVKKNKRV
jgi:hypothetical protein